MGQILQANMEGWRVFAEPDHKQFTILIITLQWNLYNYYGYLGTSRKCPDYQGVLIFQVSLNDNVSFWTTARCVDYVGVHIFKCPD